MPAERAEWRAMLPLYLGLLGMVLSSLVALGEALDTPEFVVRMHMLAFIGLGASLLGLARGRNPALIGAVIAAVVFPLLVLANTGAAFTRLFFPDEALSDHTLLLPALAAWGIVALSFAQVNRANSIFIFVCGLVIFGLTGTVNISNTLLASFFAFLLSTFFVWGYNNVINLRLQAGEAGQSLPLQPKRWAHTQIGIGIALLAVVFGSSIVTGYPAYTYTPSFFGTAYNRRHLRRIAATPRNFSGFAREFSITGGRIVLSDQHVMTVYSDRADLWRGLVYDRYDGRTWSRSRPIRGTIAGIPRRHHELEPKLPPRPSTRREHRFDTKVILGTAAPAPATPVTLDLPRARGAQLDYYDCLHIDFGRGRGGRSYRVTTQAPDVTAADLAAAPGSYEGEIEDLYVKQVPVEAMRDLQPLADEITAGCASAYDKVVAIQQHLYNECRYTLDVPPVPLGQEAVSYFLLKTQLGACDMYASALAILLRLSGVPARVATGFAEGEYSAEEGGFIVTGQDAHAWTEVYFPAIGWVPFDQPVQNAPDRFSWLAKLFQPGWVGPTLRSTARNVLFFILGIAALNALVLGIAGSSPAQVAAAWWRRRRTQTNPRQRVALAYTSVCRALGRRGIPRPGWQTPTDYGRRLARFEGLPESIRGHSVDEFTRRFLELRYGAREPNADEVRGFVAHAGALARRIRRTERTKGNSPPPN